MKGKKELLADILFNSRLVNLFKRLPMRNKLIVLNYHRIRPHDPGFTTEFDDGVYNLDADEFERQVKWLKYNTLVLSESDLMDCCQHGEFSHPQTSRPCVVITFDDGYRDNYTLAYPILRAYETPAILFVATHMIDSRQLSWWDVIAYLIKRCDKPFIMFNGRQFSLGPQKNEAISHFQQLMKQEPYEKTKYLASELSEICEVALPAPDIQDREILTWDQIQDMAAHNIAIGSHTHTHRVLTTISPSAQKEEMILSKLIIEKHIHRPVFSISYPVGESRYITAETAQFAASSGYLLGFTTNTGVNDWKGIRPYTVKRIARLLEKVATVSLLTILPEIFTWDSAAAHQIKMMEIHPTYADAYYRLGIIHLGRGKIGDAIRSLQEAVRFNPDYTEARIKLGICQAISGDYDNAEKNFRFILDKRPSFADVHYYLGMVYAARKEISLAVECLEKAIAVNPAYIDAVLKLGILYCQQRQYRLALDMLERIRKLNPSDSELEALVTTGQSILEMHPETSDELTLLFTSYTGGADTMSELIGGFVSHLNISPNLSDIMAIVEKEGFSSDSLKALLPLFLEYRETFPEYSDIHYMLGVLYKKLGQRDDAERCFKESLRLNPNYVKARLHLFNLLKEQGRFVEAAEQGGALERFNLLYPDLYCGLAETYLGLSRYAEAEQFARKAISINPAYAAPQQVIQQIRAQMSA